MFVDNDVVDDFHMSSLWVYLLQESGVQIGSGDSISRCCVVVWVFVHLFFLPDKVVLGSNLSFPLV